MKRINKTYQLRLGSILSYLQIFVGIAVNLLFTPLMIRSLGQNEYGLYNTIASTISVISLLNLGFSSGYIKFFAVYKKNNETEKIAKLNGMFLIIFSVLGLIAFACGIFLVFNLRLVFNTGLTNSEYSIARVLMLLLSVNLAISFPMTVFTCIISANERFVFLKTIGIIKTVLGPMISIPLLLLGLGSIPMVLVTVSVSVLTDTLYIYYVIRKLHNKFVFRRFEKRVVRDLFVFTFFIAVNLIVDQINWNIDNILLARFKGTTATAIYSVGYALFTYYQLFSMSISGVFTPKIHDIIVQNKEDKHALSGEISDLFIKVGRIQFAVLGLLLTGIVFFGKDFIQKIWAGEEYLESYYVIVILASSATIALIQNTGIEVQRALNKHKFRSVIYLIMASLNLILSIFLCQRFGPVGSTIGTAISLLLANGLIMNIYYQKKCFINIKLFWKNILSMSKFLIIPIIFGIIYFNLFSFSIRSFVVGIIAYSIIYVASYILFGMNNYEKNLYLSIIKAVKKGDYENK